MGRRHEASNKPFFHTRQEETTRVPAPADLDCSRFWYLVRCKPRMEGRAAAGLQEAGCAVFLPRLHRVIRIGRRVIEHDVATYPGYLFASGVPFRANRRDEVQPDRVTVLTVNGRPVDDIRDIDGVIDVLKGADGWACKGETGVAVSAFTCLRSWEV